MRSLALLAFLGRAQLNPPTFRRLMKLLLKSLLISLSLAAPALADYAPSSLVGTTFIAVIFSGSGVFATYGGFKLSTISASAYTIGPITSSVAGSTGTYVYSKTGTNTAQVSEVDSTTGIRSTTVITFTSATEAIYSTTATILGGQTGALYLEAAEPNRFLDISTLGTIGNGPFSAGFVIAGPSPKTVLIRAIGPTLKVLGVTNVSPAAQFAVYSGSTVVASNSAWGTAAKNGALVTAFNQTGAFALPDGSADSAAIATLAPGLYSATVTGSPGTALVEVYEIPQ